MTRTGEVGHAGVVTALCDDPTIIAALFRPMKIVVHAVCFNEEKLLPFFLDYYARFASRIVIWDNFSTDLSEQIATSHIGTHVEVRKFDTGNEFREDVNVLIKNNCWKNDDADWAIVCDVDEFLYVPDLPAFLAKRQGFNIFRPVGYNMVSAHFPVRGTQITEQIQCGVLSENYSKMVLFKPAGLAEMNFGPGSHKANPVGNPHASIYDARHFNADLKLLHYKNVSFDYRYRKNLEYAQRVGAISKQNNWNFHFARDEQQQRAEFDELLKHAKKVLP